MIGARLRKIDKVAFRFDDHQVYIERLCCRATHRVHDRRTERDVRHKSAVHDIDMDPIGAGFVDCPDFLSEPEQIGGQNWGGDDDRLHDALVSVETYGRMKRSIALAKPSSSKESVTKSACACTSGLALPIAML